MSKSKRSKKQSTVQQSAVTLSPTFGMIVSRLAALCDALGTQQTMFLVAGMVAQMATDNPDNIELQEKAQGILQLAMSSTGGQA